MKRRRRSEALEATREERRRQRQHEEIVQKIDDAAWKANRPPFEFNREEHQR